MQEERSMILNMLKEGKISVEEAEALLEVLNEDGTEESAGFATNEEASGGPMDDAGADTTGDANKDEGFAFTIGGDDAGTGGKERRASSGPHGFKLDLDLGGLKGSLRETMKSVKDAMKDVMGELSDLDLGEEIFRSMGRKRGESATTITEDAGGAERLVITNKWGSVRITGGDGEEMVVRSNASAWGPSQFEADEALERLDVRLERDGDAWNVRTGLENAIAGRIRIDYEVTLPRRMGATVSSGSGDIWIEELEGEQVVKTLSGDITIADLGSVGDVPQVVKTRSGDVVGGALTGDITLNSFSGDVEINGFTGRLRVATQSGDITIQDGDGSVELKTMSGDIAAELTSVGVKPVLVSSVSGDVDLGLPSGIGLDVSVKTTSGDLAVDLELQDAQRGERAISGVANGGGTEVTVSTVSGDVSISES